MDQVVLCNGVHDQRIGDLCVHMDQSKLRNVSEIPPLYKLCWHFVFGILTVKLRSCVVTQYLNYGRCYASSSMQA